MERVDGGSSIVVGDAVWDVEAAHRLGVPAVALLSGGVGEGELRSAGAAWVFRDVAELRERLDTVLAPCLTGRHEAGSTGYGSRR